MKKFLIIQTAFLGDVILTLPTVQLLKRMIPDSEIDFMAIPETSEILKSHPDISRLRVYDKHGKQKTLASFVRFKNELRGRKYDAVICPHRSLRSCLLTKFSKAGIRVGFDNSAMKSCFTDLLPWRFGVHEVDRNLSLLKPLGINIRRELPRIFPTAENVEQAEGFLLGHEVQPPFAVVAPGTVWQTKRYPVEMMAEVAEKLSEKFASVVVIGGSKDMELAQNFDNLAGRVIPAIGKFPIMTSAEIIRRASLLIANDSAPVHIASAFNVPTVAIFGPTVRNFGFAPYHEKSVVVEVDGLSCRPCTIHGGPRCPIGTFDCMKKISPDRVVEMALKLLDRS
ncbi:MAG: glycosyltransferase family 9 protein [Candidatus Kryptoniota bacterium]